MHIVTDSGTDVSLTGSDIAELDIHIVPLIVNLAGKSYREGEDLQHEDFYRMLSATSSMPSTSQPSAGEFANLYRKLAVTNPEIISLHISTGLSGTINAARLGASLVPEAHVTHINTGTISSSAGWQVEAAARAARAGWTMEDIMSLLKRIQNSTDIIFTLNQLQHLINGGRISHMKGLIASTLNIKPLIGIDRSTGMLIQQGQARSFEKAIHAIVTAMLRKHKPGSKLRTQIRHSNSPEGAQLLYSLVNQHFDCTWMPMGYISCVLGAHAGPGLVGIGFAPLEVFQDIP